MLDVEAIFRLEHVEMDINWILDYNRERPTLTRDTRVQEAVSIEAET